jgi:ATP-dependent DNA helicase HFM1/MER3
LASCPDKQQISASKGCFDTPLILHYYYYTAYYRARIQRNKIFLDLATNFVESRCHRFPIDGKVKDSETKVSILAQAHLGCLNITDSGLQRESVRIVQICQRLSRCLAELLWTTRDDRNLYKAIKNSVILAKCFDCAIWNNSENVSKQFERVGIAYSTSLVHAGFTSFHKISGANPRELEMALNKQPPFGNHLRSCAMHMPEYSMDVEQASKIIITFFRTHALTFSTNWQVPSQTKNSAPNSVQLKISVSLVNPDALLDRSTAGPKHACVLIVGNQKNETLMQIKVKDSILLTCTENRYERTITVNSRAGFPTTHVRADLISEKFSGLDVSKHMQPKFAGGSAPAAAAAGRGLDFDFDSVFPDVDISPTIMREMEIDWTPNKAKKGKFTL